MAAPAVSSGTDATVLSLNSNSASTRLKILKKIGRGGFADVYRAQFDGQLHALKVLRTDGRDVEEKTMLFLSEARALHAHKHMYVIGFHGLLQLPAEVMGKLQNRHELGWAMLLEYAEEGSIAALVKKQMHAQFTFMYSDKEALIWVIQIAEAVAFLHNKTPAIIHRDIKLDNTLLKPNGDKMIAKLCDFGLVVAADSKERQTVLKTRNADGTTTTTVTTTGAGKPKNPNDVVADTLAPAANDLDLNVGGGKAPGADKGADKEVNELWQAVAAHKEKTAKKEKRKGNKGNKFADNKSEDGRSELAFTLTGKTGSSMYMAPEVYKEEPYNEKVDVFSFGIIMYELYARQLLIYTQCRTGSEHEVESYAYKVAFKGFRPPQPERIDKEIWEIITDCWESDPLERPDINTVLIRLKEYHHKKYGEQPGCQCTIS